MELANELMEKRKKMIFDFINRVDYEPIKFKDMANILSVPKKERDEFRKLLGELIREGKIIEGEDGRIKLTNGCILVGKFSGTPKGFGFVSIEDEEEDIFISALETANALNGDIVQVRISEQKKGKHREGRIIKILEHGNNEVVGTFNKSKNFGFVIPDNSKFGRDIYIPKDCSKGAVTGHKVVVKIIDYGSIDKKPEGEIIEILGHVNDPGVDIISIVKANGIPDEFSEDVMKYVEKLPDAVDANDIKDRLDLRSWQTVTIDGEDAKDLDDAITISKKGNIYELGVHIADVSNYVKEGSVLDKEAIKRGTSVYLVDRVIPMLPHKLSNGICSLNQGSDRLALSCIMDIDEKGNVVGHKIAETVLNVDRRMSYTSVKRILEDKDEEEIKKYKDFVPMFELMLELATLLREKRKKRGSIDFDFPETKIIVDEKCMPIDIEPYERNKATKIIEDFMLIANETIAEDYFWQELPFVYRTHEAPDPEKIQKLAIFINNFGYTIKGGLDEIHPKELQKLLVKIEDKPEEALISRLTLRSMKRAKYTVTNDGHFGLSTKYYCHFTSPIRRYPDLQIHRIIKENLKKGLLEKRIAHYNKILPDIAQHSSIAERRADEAEREVEKLKKVEYMQKFLGEQFTGVISGINTWGMYIELPNTIEGMVKITELKDDYYIYDEEHYCLIGEVTKKTYNLGDTVKIEVINCNKETRTIDFILAEENEQQN